MSTDLIRDALATAGVDESALGAVETLAFPAPSIEEARAPLRPGVKVDAPLAVRSHVLDAIGLDATFDPAARQFVLAAMAAAADLTFAVEPGGHVVRTDTPSAFVIATGDGAPLATGAVRGGGVQLRVLHAWPLPPLRIWRAAAGDAEWALLAGNADAGDVDRWQAALVAGRVARLWRTPGDARAALAAMAAGARDGSPSLATRLWARGLSTVQRTALERFAVVDAGHLAARLARLRELVEPQDLVSATTWRKLCAERDDLEGVRVLLRESGAGDALATALAAADEIGRAVRFSWPGDLDVHDARLQRAAEADPHAWWGSTRFRVALL